MNAERDVSMMGRRISFAFGKASGSARPGVRPSRQSPPASLHRDLRLQIKIRPGNAGAVSRTEH